MKIQIIILPLHTLVFFFFFFDKNNRVVKLNMFEKHERESIKWSVKESYQAVSCVPSLIFIGHYITSIHRHQSRYVF